MRHYMTQTNHSWHEQVRGFQTAVDSHNCVEPFFFLEVFSQYSDIVSVPRVCLFLHLSYCNKL